jgi:hypothetical protein
MSADVEIVIAPRLPNSPDMFSLLTLIMLLTLISRSLRFKLMLDLELSLRRNVLRSLAWDPRCPDWLTADSPEAGNP